jgi:hypothetical protein
MLLDHPPSVHVALAQAFPGAPGARSASDPAFADDPSQIAAIVLAVACSLWLWNSATAVVVR